MIKEKITNYAVRTSFNSVYQPEAYEFKPKNKFSRWILEILLKKKVISLHYHLEPVFTRIEINDEEVLDLIRHLQHEMYLRDGTSAVKVILGADKYGQLGFELKTEMTHYMTMHMDGSKGPKVFGLEIVFNPFIDGLVLLK